MGRGDAVEVPRRRLGRAVGRAAASGAIATQAYANPRYGPDGLALLREGLERRGGRRAADRGRRRPRPPPARRRRRARAAARPSPAPSAWTGPAAAPGRLRRAGEHPRLGRDRRRARRDLRGDRRRAARRAAARLPRRGAGRRRRPARPAVGGAARRRARRRLRGPLRQRRRPARRRPRAPLEELRRIYGLHQAIFGKTPRRTGSTSTTSSPPSCASGSARLGYDGELDEALDAWAGNGEPGGARRRGRAGRPGRARGAEEADVSGQRSRRIDELEPSRSRGQDGLTWRPVRRHFGISAFGVNAYTAERGGQRVVEEHREEGGPRGAVRRHHRPRDLHARRRGARRAGRHARPLPARARCAAPSRRRPGRPCSAIGAKPGEAFEPSGWEWAFAGMSLLSQGAGGSRAARVRRRDRGQPGRLAGLLQLRVHRGRLGEPRRGARPAPARGRARPGRRREVGARGRGLRLAAGRPALPSDRRAGGGRQPSS